MRQRNGPWAHFVYSHTFAETGVEFITYRPMALRLSIWRGGRRGTEFAEVFFRDLVPLLPNDRGYMFGGPWYSGAVNRRTVRSVVGLQFSSRKVVPQDGTKCMVTRGQA